MKIKILSVFIVATIQTCLAQDKALETKNDIGFNTNIILNGILNSTGAPFVFMYKRQVDENKAIRYGVSFNLNLSSPSGTINNGTNQSSVFVNPSIGKEWQATISKRWIWYRGVDIRGSISQSSFSNYFNGVQSSSQDRSSYGLFIAPLIGVRFAISERLYAATEANLSIGYSVEKTSNKSFINGNQSTVDDFTNNRFSAGTAPAFGVFLFYRF